MRVALLWPIFFPIQAHLHMSENGNSPPRCRWAPSCLRARATAGLENLFLPDQYRSSGQDLLDIVDCIPFVKLIYNLEAQS